MKNSRHLLLALPLALTLIANAAAQEAPPQQSTPTQLVDALNGVFGKHAGARAVHAKGVVLEGQFTPSPTAASISKAVHLQASAVADNLAAQKSLMFLPNNVPAGIEPQDPMINARSAAYPVSFGRRQ
ncbi:MAG: Catalase-related peroxidase [Pseudomonas fluorescens]|nr:MAG: Catalase-related peroxidase [Pseudomonas fluorescens]